MSTYNDVPDGFNPDDWLPLDDADANALRGHVDRALALPQSTLTVSREVILPLADLMVEVISAKEYVGVERRRSASEFQVMFIPETAADGPSETDGQYVSVSYSSNDGCSVDVNGEIEDDADSTASLELCFYAGQLVRSLVRLDSCHNFLLIPELADQYYALHGGVADMLDCNLEQLLELVEAFNTPEDILESSIKNLPGEIMKLLKINRIGNLMIHESTQLEVEGEEYATFSHIDSTTASVTMGQDRLRYRKITTPSNIQVVDKEAPYVAKSYLVLVDNQAPTVITEESTDKNDGVDNYAGPPDFVDPVFGVSTRKAVKADLARVKPDLEKLTARYGI